MEQSFDQFDSPVTPWSYSTDGDHLALPSILVVEDDADIREMLRTLLELAGFVPVACDTAEAGLTALREQSFDLVLTDYALPQRSGLWLLETAQREGLLEGVPTLIVTAHPSVAGSDDYEVVQKPFDLDDLVERVRQRMDVNRPRRPRQVPEPSPNGRQSNDGGSSNGCPDPIELILYVSAHSPHSAAAVRNIEKVLSRFKSSRVKLTIRDLTANPGSGAEDNIAFTPTLVRRAPGPRTFILGHLTNPEVLMELLADCDPDEES